MAKNPELINYLDLWEQWLNETLATGIHHLGSSTQASIRQWQLAAQTLGLQNYAQCAEILLKETDQQAKVAAFSRCLLGYQALRQLFETESLM